MIPRRHILDIRDLDDATGAAVMAAVSRISRAVSAAFSSGGLSIWHSAGAAANQEVPHLHVHVHPRHLGDGLLRVYPTSPSTPVRAVLDQYAARIRENL